MSSIQPNKLRLDSVQTIVKSLQTSPLDGDWMAREKRQRRKNASVRKYSTGMFRRQTKICWEIDMKYF